MGYNLNPIFTNSGEFQFSSEKKLLDPFYGSAVAPTSEKEQLIYTFKIQNLFQTKHNDDDEIQKNNILDWNFGTTYDAFADSLNWSPISSKLRSKIPGFSNIDIDLIYDIYDIENNGARINKYKNERF